MLTGCGRCRPNLYFGVRTSRYVSVTSSCTSLNFVSGRSTVIYDAQIGSAGMTRAARGLRRKAGEICSSPYLDLVATARGGVSSTHAEVHILRRHRLFISEIVSECGRGSGGVRQQVNGG